MSNDRTTQSGDQGAGAGPPPAEAETADQRAALQSTCRFLGKTFYEGDTICYREREWVCSAGSWQETGNAC